MKASSVLLNLSDTIKDCEVNPFQLGQKVSQSLPVLLRHAHVMVTLCRSNISASKKLPCIIDSGLLIANNEI